MIQTNVRHRYHNATGTGELGTPSSTQPKARVTYAAMYAEPLGRTIAAADCLVTSVTFDAAGRQYASTDPADRTDKFNMSLQRRQILHHIPQVAGR